MNILLDCDDVLTQFTQGVIDVLNEKHGHDFDINDVTDWDMAHSLGISNKLVFGIAGEEGFCTDLNMMPGAQEAVEKLKKYGSIYVVTAPIYTSKTWMFERTRWLYEHFGINGGHVIQTSAKHLIRGDVFIDDRSNHVEKWFKHNEDMTGIVMEVSWPRQQTCDEELLHSSWDEVLMSVNEAWEKQPS